MLLWPQYWPHFSNSAHPNKSFKNFKSKWSTTKHPQLHINHTLLPFVWFLTRLFNIGEKMREHIRSWTPFQPATAGPRLCTLWCCPAVAGAQCPQVHLLASSSNNQEERRRLTRFIGSGNLLLLSCSPRLLSHSPPFPLLSFPPLVISLPAKCTLPQELPCSCFVSFLSPQTSSPSAVQFQPASAAAVSLLRSHSSFSLLHTEAEASPMPTPHSHGCAQPPPAAFTSLVLAGLSIL